MSDFDSILDEADETEPVVESTTSTETEPVAEAVAEETPVAAVDVPEGEATPAEATPTLPDGYKLDALGRVHGPDGRVVSKEEAERIKAQAVPVAPEPVVPEVAPVTPEPAPVTPPAEFTFRANGQKVSIPGLVVPPEQQEYVRNLLVAGMNHHQNFPRMQAEWKQKLAAAEQMATAKAERYHRPALAAANAVIPGRNGEMPSLLSAILADIPAEYQRTVADRWYREAEYLRRDMAHLMREADMKMPASQPPAEPQANEQQIEQAARATLSGYVNELFEDTPDAAKYFTAEDRKELAAAMDTLLAAYFDQIDGEIMLDTEKVKAHFNRELNLLKRSHQAREVATRDAQKAKQAAAFNAAQKPIAAQPPAPRKPTPAVAAVPSGKPKGWDQDFKSAWYDDDEG